MNLAIDFLGMHMKIRSSPLLARSDSVWNTAGISISIGTWARSL